MIYALSAATFQASGGIFSTTIYTVPPPIGKQAGISRDGKLHLVQVRSTDQVPPNPLPVFTLEYWTSDGILVARFVDTSWIGANSAGVDMDLTWASEPYTNGAIGHWSPAFPPYGDVGASGNQGGFTWLLSGWVVKIGGTGGNGPHYTVNAVVEDYGQLAEGGEHASRRAGQAAASVPVYLQPQAIGG